MLILVLLVFPCFLPTSITQIILLLIITFENPELSHASLFVVIYKFTIYQLPQLEPW